VPDKPEKSRRIPNPVDGIQINFCKNPSCANFGIPASNQTQSRGGKQGQDIYIVCGKNANKELLCRKCGEYIPIKSNQSIHEELTSISAYLEPKPLPSCTNPDCTNTIMYVGTSIALREKCYSKFGKTKNGSQRYRCNACGKTFVIPTDETSPIARQTKSHVNYLIFRSLVRKMPLCCIAETVGVDPKTVYDKMDFFHHQCLAFAASRERDIPSMGGARVPSATSSSAN
jgi:transposase-like protein